MITGINDGFERDASIQSIISTTSFPAYARAYAGLRNNIRYDAEKLVAIETVLKKRLGVSNAFNMK